MILNAADNIMLGDTEVQKVYCGDELVWERRKIPPQYTALTELDLSAYSTNEIGFNSGYRPTSGILAYDVVLSRIRGGGGEKGYCILGNLKADPFKDTEISPHVYYYRWWFMASYAGQIRQRVKNFTNGALNVLQTSTSYADYNVTHHISGRMEPLLQTLRVDEDEYSLAFEKPASITQRDVWCFRNGDLNNISESGDFAYGLFSVQSLKIYDDTTLVRDFVPVNRTSDNIDGFWDFCTKQFYLPYTPIT